MKLRRSKEDDVNDANATRESMINFIITLLELAKRDPQSSALFKKIKIKNLTKSYAYNKERMPIVRFVEHDGAENAPPANTLWFWRYVIILDHSHGIRFWTISSFWTLVLVVRSATFGVNKLCF